MRTGFLTITLFKNNVDANCVSLILVLLEVCKGNHIWHINWMIKCFHLVQSLISLCEIGFTLVLCDRYDIFSTWGQAENLSTINTSFCLHIVLKGTVYSSIQDGNILSLKHQLEEERKAEFFNLRHYIFVKIK